MLIVNGTIHTMESSTIPDGFVLIKGSRIAQTGPMDSLPDDADLTDLIDAQGGHVLPGFLDAHCHLGLYGCAAPRTT